MSRRYTLSPAALKRPSWQNVRSYTHGSPQYFRTGRGGSRKVHGTPEVASFSDDFFGFHEIGRGSFGKVFRCVRKLDLHSYAVKEVVREYGSIRDRCVNLPHGPRSSTLNPGRLILISLSIFHVDRDQYPNRTRF